jgi:hypothetical protein
MTTAIDRDATLAKAFRERRALAIKQRATPPQAMRQVSFCNAPTGPAPNTSTAAGSGAAKDTAVEDPFSSFSGKLGSPQPVGSAHPPAAPRQDPFKNFSGKVTEPTGSGKPDDLFKGRN